MRQRGVQSQAEWGTVPGRAKQQGTPAFTHSRPSEARGRPLTDVHNYGLFCRPGVRSPLPVPGVTAGSRGGCQGRPWGLGQLLARCSCHRQTNLQTPFSAPHTSRQLFAPQHLFKYLCRRDAKSSSDGLVWSGTQTMAADFQSLILIFRWKKMDPERKLKLLRQQNSERILDRPGVSFTEGESCPLSALRACPLSGPPARHPVERGGRRGAWLLQASVLQAVISGHDKRGLSRPNESLDRRGRERAGVCSSSLPAATDCPGPLCALFPGPGSRGEEGRSAWDPAALAWPVLGAGGGTFCRREPGSEAGLPPTPASAW